jgi:hypothetical protein
MKKPLRIVLTLCALVLASALIGTEPRYQTVSASQTVGSIAFPNHTKFVRVVSDGPDQCYFRLFTDVDIPGNATTSSAPIKSGESLGFPIYQECGGAAGATCRDSESYNADGRRAAYYKSLSYVCASTQSATWRVYSK